MTNYAKHMRRLCFVVGPTCESGFSYVSAASGCYKIGRYIPWIGALETCKLLHDNSRLVVISSAQEQSAIVDWWTVQPGVTITF